MRGWLRVASRMSQRRTSHVTRLNVSTSHVARRTSGGARLLTRVLRCLLIIYDYVACVFHDSVDTRAMLGDILYGRCRERDLVTPKRATDVLSGFFVAHGSRSQLEATSN